MTNQFIEDIKITIGVDFHVKTMKIANNEIKLQIWDFGGEERFRFLFPSYILGASGGIFMYDITNYSTLTHIDDWLLIVNKIFDGKKRPKIPIIVVGGKSDLNEFREVVSEEAKIIAESRGTDDFIECSSRTGENVEKVFDSIIKLILDYQSPY